MYRFMRVLVFFDLPVADKERRKRYTEFRRFLLNDGYDMLQYSVYARVCRGLDGAKKHINRLESHLPPEGAVRSMMVTDKQYSDMHTHLGDATTQEKALQDTLFTYI